MRISAQILSEFCGRPQFVIRADDIHFQIISIDNDRASSNFLAFPHPTNAIEES